MKYLNRFSNNYFSLAGACAMMFFLSARSKAAILEKMGCMGNSIIRTPDTDWLANNLANDPKYQNQILKFQTRCDNMIGKLMLAREEK
jgi:hypothetical protein